jgi:hypothetical protein
MNVHPYYLGKARRIMREAGGDPGDAEALAEWGQKAIADPANNSSAKTARGPHDLFGVFVAEDGEIMAETRRAAGDRVPASYCTGDGAKRWGVEHVEAGMALSEIRRASGKSVIFVKSSRFSGPAEKEEA